MSTISGLFANESPDWVEVSEKEAFRHPLYGLGGFSLVFVAFHLITPVLVVYLYLVHPFDWTFGGDVIARQIGMVTVITDIIWSVLCIMLCVSLIIKFLYFRECVILLYVLWFLDEIIFIILLYWASIQTGENATFMSFVEPQAFFGVMMFGGLWVQYVYSSRRIAVTILHRVLRKDLQLVRDS